MYFYYVFVTLILGFYICFFINLLSEWRYFSSVQFMIFWTGKNIMTVVVVVSVGGALFILLKKHAYEEYQREKLMIVIFIFIEVFTNLAFIFQEIDMLKDIKFYMND
jgi:hypothetical protein